MVLAGAAAAAAVTQSARLVVDAGQVRGWTSQGGGPRRTGGCGRVSRLKAADAATSRARRAAAMARARRRAVCGGRMGLRGVAVLQGALEMREPAGVRLALLGCLTDAENGRPVAAGSRWSGRWV